MGNEGSETESAAEERGDGGEENLEAHEEAVLRLAAASSDPGGRISREDHQAIREALGRALRRPFPGEDIDDAVDEAIVRFITAVSRGRVDVGGNPAGYLYRIARRVMLDTIARRAESPMEDVGDRSDPATLEQLCAVEDAAQIEWMFSRLRALRDVEARRVLAAARDLAAIGREVTVRSVAERAELPPTTTWRALKRIRALLADEVLDQ